MDLLGELLAEVIRVRRREVSVYLAGVEEERAVTYHSGEEDGLALCEHVADLPALEEAYWRLRKEAVLLSLEPEADPLKLVYLRGVLSQVAFVRDSALALGGAFGEPGTGQDLAL
jgi:hypothetical protein